MAQQRSTGPADREGPARIHWSSPSKASRIRTLVPRLGP